MSFCGMLKALKTTYPSDLLVGDNRGLVVLLGKVPFHLLGLGRMMQVWHREVTSCGLVAGFGDP